MHDTIASCFPMTSSLIDIELVGEPREARNGWEATVRLYCYDSAGDERQLLHAHEQDCRVLSARLGGDRALEYLRGIESALQAIPRSLAQRVMPQQLFGTFVFANSDLREAKDFAPRLLTAWEQAVREADQQDVTDPNARRIDELLESTVERLRDARGDESAIRRVFASYIERGVAMGMSPMQLRDHVDISTPGLAEHAGYRGDEVDRASQLYEQVGREIWKRTTSA